MSAPRALLLAGGRVLDPEGELDRPPVMDILIEQGRIAALGEEATARAGASGAEVIDASGRLVTPGFVNAHSHSHDTLLRGMFEQLPLEVWGLTAFPFAWPRRSEAEVGLRSLLHAEECLRGGITTVQDMVTIVGPDRTHAEAVVDAYARSGVRAVVGVQFGDRAAVDGVPFLLEELPSALHGSLPGAVDPLPMQRFVEALLDELSAPRLSWALAPSAPQRCSEALLSWAAALSRERGLQVCTHVYETRSQAVLARLAYGQDGGSMIRHLQRLGLLNPRLVIAHGVWIADEEVALLGAAGAHLACNPMANLKLLNGAAPVRRYADAGASISLGCDNSSAGDAQSIFESMKAFAQLWALQSSAGETGAAAAAFRAATLGGARALGMEGEIGGVRPGHLADLALFDLTDPVWRPLNSAVRQLVYAESGRSLRTVLVGGEVVVRDGSATRLDAGALTRAAEEARSAMEEELAAIAARSAPMAAALLRMHERVRRQPLAFDRLRLN
jgi:cytosine/adenosine deaminase-related metal-dependent hydrolase